MATVEHFELVDVVSNSAKYYRTVVFDSADNVGIVAWGRRGAAGQLQVVYIDELRTRRSAKASKGYEMKVKFRAELPPLDALRASDTAARDLNAAVEAAWHGEYSDGSVPATGKPVVVELADAPAVLCHRPYSADVARAVSQLQTGKPVAVTGKLDVWLGRNAISALTGKNAARLLVMPADTAAWVSRYGGESAVVVGEADESDTSETLQTAAQMLANRSAQDYLEAFELARLLDI
jgi:predicted DNA-binding WGR domain protein